ncbi:MAG TPA: aminoglycoside 6'-N-acetyltransferase [Gammaproteobacteria bacterium]|nr:aminoglycoside 6'-N-acetyltransferase [Gammaproteobacteria bacterium]
MNVTIRAAAPSDLGDWTRLRQTLWPDCPPERHRLEVTQVLGSPGIVALAFADDTLAGFAEVSVRSDHVEGTQDSPVPYLEGWFVESAYRGQGIGKALIAFVERWAGDNGYSELASDAELENQLSIRLHHRLGFREVGRSVHFVKQLNSERS